MENISLLLEDILALKTVISHITSTNKTLNQLIIKLYILSLRELFYQVRRNI